MKIYNPLIFILLSFSGLLLNCNSYAQDQIHNNTETIVKKFIEFANSGNLNMIDELFTENCIYEDVPDQMSYYGIDEVKSFLGELYEWSPDLKVEYTSTFYKDDWAAAEWIWSGTQTGEIKGLIEATGRQYSIRGTTIFQFKNGKIKRLSDYYNAGRFLYQLGVKFVFPSGDTIKSPK
jgi:steroid delta-isomerase-like uncharacterized protein